MSAVVGQILRASPGSVFGTPPFTMAYVWRRDGVDIAGADEQEYPTVDADAGATLTVRQTTTNDFGSDSRVSVDAIEVSGAPPSIDTLPVISGTTAVNETLTVTLGDVSGTGPITDSVQWLRNGDAIEGATGLTYEQVAEDAGAMMGVTQEAVSAWGAATASGAEVGPVTSGAVAPTNDVAPAIALVGTSDPRVGDLYAVTSDGTWSGTGPITYTYDWTLGGVSTGIATSTYQATAPGDVECEVTASGPGGSSAPAASNAIAVRALAPVDVTALAGYAFTRASVATDGLPSAALPADDVDSYAINAIRDVAAKIASGDPARYLIESARQQLHLYSSDFDTQWGATGTVTVTAGQSDPMGGTAAARVATPSGNNYVLRTATGVPAARTARSLWVRQGPGSGVYNVFNNNPNIAVGATAGEWTRVEWVADSTGANTQWRVQDGANRSGDGGLAAGARDAVVWQAQMEAGRWASSAILSLDGVMETRAADDLAAQLPEILCRGVAEHHLVMPQSSADFLAASDDAVIVTDGLDHDLRVAISGTDIIVSLTTDTGTYTSDPITWSAGDRIRIVVDWIDDEMRVYVGAAASLTGTLVDTTAIAGEWTPSTACDLLHDGAADHVTGRGGFLA